jgi:hypothetical protein
VSNVLHWSSYCIMRNVVVVWVVVDRVMDKEREF